MTTDSPDSPSLPSYLTILKWIFAQGFRGYEVVPEVAEIIARSPTMSEIASSTIIDTLADECARDRPTIIAEIHQWAETIGAEAYVQAPIPTRIAVDKDLIKTQQAAQRAARVVLGLAARQQALIQRAMRAIGGWMQRTGERLPQWSAEKAERALEKWGERLARAALAQGQKNETRAARLQTRDDVLAAAFGGEKKVPGWVRGEER